MLHSVPSTRLGAFVAITDVLVWLGGLPWVVYNRMLLTVYHWNTLVLVWILVSNAIVLVAICYALFAANELLRRGIRRRSLHS